MHLLSDKRVSVLNRLNLEKRYGLSPETKQTLHNNEVSVLSGCTLRQWGSTVLFAIPA